MAEGSSCPRDPIIRRPTTSLPPGHAASVRCVFRTSSPHRWVLVCHMSLRHYTADCGVNASLIQWESTGSSDNKGKWSVTSPTELLSSRRQNQVVFLWITDIAAATYIMYGLTAFVTCLFTYLLTYSLHGAESSWEADRFSASQEIPRILLNHKFHYRINKFPPPVPILSQINPVHAPTSYFLKIHLILYSQLRLCFPSCLCSSSFNTKIL